MGDWYQVVKTIKGNQYRYLQQTYREGGRVRTRNRYLGRVDAGATSNPAGSPNKETQAPAAAVPLFQSPSDFGAAMLMQFDAPQWEKDAQEQLLGSAVSGGTTAGRSSKNRRPLARFNFNRPVAYNPQAKRRFHLRARRQLRKLAAVLGLQSGDYDLRSNQGGITVSGEVYLHSDHLYVCVEQSVMGNGTGILFRRCQGRRDYGGHGGNNFAPLDLLNDPDELARRISKVGLHHPAQTPVTTTHENRGHSPSFTMRPSVDPEAYNKYRRAQQRYNGAFTDEQFHQAKRALDEAIKSLQASGLTEGQQAYIKNHPNIQTMDGQQFIPKTIEQLVQDYKTPDAYITALRTMQQPEEIAREFYTTYAIKTQTDIEPALRTIWAQQHPQRPVTTTQQETAPNPRPGQTQNQSRPPLDPSELRQFTGTENRYRHSLVPDILLTDGAKYVAEKAGAYWLMDEIALAQRDEPTAGAQDFQVWKLAVSASQTAVLTCGDGNGNTVFSKTIAYTDFPIEGIELWCENKTILLPSER